MRRTRTWVRCVRHMSRPDIVWLPAYKPLFLRLWVASEDFMRKVIPSIGYQLQHIAQFRSVSATIEHGHDFHHVVVVLFVINGIPDMIQSKIALGFLQHIHEY